VRFRARDLRHLGDGIGFQSVRQHLLKAIKSEIGYPEDIVPSCTLKGDEQGTKYGVTAGNLSGKA
jgi:hypothetical protein